MRKSDDRHLSIPRKREFRHRSACFHIMSEHDRISTMERLLLELEALAPGQDHLDILRRLDLDMKTLEPWCGWNARRYTRTCVKRTDDLELLVVCFEPGQRSSIHDSDSAMAWVHVVSGELLEERFIRKEGELVRTDTFDLKPGAYSVMHVGEGIIRFTAPDKERAVALSYYARPLRKWNVYSERASRLLKAFKDVPKRST